MNRLEKRCLSLSREDRERLVNILLKSLEHMATGKTMDETFGLIETVEKAAQIYMLTAHLPRVNTIKDEEMVTLAEFFDVKYRRDFLNLECDEKSAK